MKSIFLRSLSICLLVLAAMSFAGPALAEDEALPDPGITPDSPLYFFDNLGKHIGMFFTFNEEARAAKALRYAEERLAEARAMAAKNRIKETERAAEGYDGYMAQVRQRLENRSISANLTERVALAAARHLDILERAGEQVSKEGRAALERARTASANGQMNALRALAKDHPVRAIDIIEENLDRQTEKAVVRLAGTMISANITDDTENALDYAAELAALEDEITALAEEKGIDVTGLMARLEHATSNRLTALSGVYENAPESARDGIQNAIENSVRKYERTLEKLQEYSTNATQTVGPRGG